MEPLLITIIILALIAIVFSSSSKIKPVESKTKPEPKRPLTEAEREAMRQADEAFDWDTHNALANRTYTGPLPEHVAFNMWTNIYPNLYNSKIAGINFRKGIKDLAGQYFSCYLEADPKNKYDQNAIKIMHADGRHLGFIPSDETEHVREFVNDQFPYMDCKGHIDEGEEYDENDRLRHFLYGTINIQKQS